MISEAIYSLLSTNEALVAKVGAQIYPVMAAQGIQAPYVVFDLNTRPNYQSKDDILTDQSTLNVLVVATKYKEVNQIADAIRAALEFVTGTIIDADITDLAFSEMLDDYFEPDEQFLKAMVFTIEHQNLPVYYNLTIATPTGGTVKPAPGVYQLARNQVQPLDATPATGYRFVQWVINAASITTDLITVTANRAIEAVAQFESIGILFERLKAFTSGAIQKGNRTYFGDYSANDNDLLVKKQRVALLSGAQYIQHLSTFNFNSDWIFKIKFKLSTAPTATQTLFSSRVGAGVGIEMTINTTTGMNFYIGGANLATINFNYLAITELKIEKIGNLYSFYINDTFIKSITNTSVIINNNPINIGAQKTTSTASVYFIGAIYEYSLTNFINCKANHGQGATIYNTLSDANHGTVIGAVLATFWGSTCDECEAFEHTQGATLYRNTTDSTKMPICGNNNYTIAGLTRVGYFAPGSGALKGLPNTYTIPVNPALNAIIPAGDYTADQLAALTTSDNLLIEQDADRVTSLIVKTA